MNIKENVKEGIKSIKVHKLRTFLTAAIIAIGIMSLVGILTAIEGIQSSINSSFSNLGANTFDVQSKRANRGLVDGKQAKIFPPLTYQDLVTFKEKYEGPGVVSIYTVLTGNAEIKYGSKVTNPNQLVRGGDENYLLVDGYDIAKGRSFSPIESLNGAYVVLVGNDVVEDLFEENEEPLGKKINIMGNKFRIVGLLKEEGGASGTSNIDRTVIVPMEIARSLAGERGLRAELAVALKDQSKMEKATSRATGLMRAIRKDRPGEENSFDVLESKSLAERLETMTGYLKAGGIAIGIITLLGASIGLMNIMLVSVTERTREIGVRKALGATPTMIRQQFLIEALVICQMGGIIGILLGIIIGNLTSWAIGTGFVIPWLWISAGFIVGMIVGLLSGVIPAVRASRLDPIASLRFE